MVLTCCLYYTVASCNYDESGTRDVGLNCWSFRIICWLHLHCMLLPLFLFLLFVSVSSESALFCFPPFFCFFLFIFFTNGNISKSTAELRCYHNTRKFRKTLNYKGPRQFGLTSFQWNFESEACLQILLWNFHRVFFAFYLFYCPNFLPRMFWKYS